MKKYLKSLVLYTLMLPLLLLKIGLFYVGTIIKSLAYLVAFHLDNAKCELETLKLIWQA